MVFIGNYWEHIFGGENLQEVQELGSVGYCGREHGTVSIYSIGDGVFRHIYCQYQHRQSSPELPVILQGFDRVVGGPGLGVRVVRRLCEYVAADVFTSKCLLQAAQICGEDWRGAEVDQTFVGGVQFVDTRDYYYQSVVWVNICRCEGGQPRERQEKRSSTQTTRRKFQHSHDPMQR